MPCPPGEGESQWSSPRPVLPTPYPSPDGGRREKEAGICSSYLCSFCNCILLVCLSFYFISKSRKEPVSLHGTSWFHSAVNSKKSGFCLVHQGSHYTLKCVCNGSMRGWIKSQSATKGHRSYFLPCGVVFLYWDLQLKWLNNPSSLSFQKLDQPRKGIGFWTPKPSPTWMKWREGTGCTIDASSRYAHVTWLLTTTRWQA